MAVFEVNSVEKFDKGRLPVDEVYGDFSRPSLRLITCGGQWVGGETGYADNVVVFASLVKARPGEGGQIGTTGQFWPGLATGNPAALAQSSSRRS